MVSKFLTYISWIFLTDWTLILTKPLASINDRPRYTNLTLLCLSVHTHTQTHTHTHTNRIFFSLPHFVFSFCFFFQSDSFQYLLFFNVPVLHFYLYFFIFSFFLSFFLSFFPVTLTFYALIILHAQPCWKVIWKKCS